MNPLAEAAQAVDIELGQAALTKLHILGNWIATEGVTAGGLGPNENESIERRHLANSVLFAGGWTEAPSRCWDLGSGIGLPGLVLALLWPETRVVLVDSSQRRCDLARRAARIVDVQVEIRQARIEKLSGPVEAIVSRAAIPASRFRPILTRLLAVGGRAVISGGLGEPSEGFEWLRFPGHESFDRESRLLMMRSP